MRYEQDRMVEEGRTGKYDGLRPRTGEWKGYIPLRSKLTSITWARSSFGRRPAMCKVAIFPQRFARIRWLAASEVFGTDDINLNRGGRRLDRMVVTVGFEG